MLLAELQLLGMYLLFRSSAAGSLCESIALVLCTLYKSEEDQVQVNVTVLQRRRG